jgi:hypothetical protein
MRAARTQAPERLTALVERLSERYADQASYEEVVTAVGQAVGAVDMFGAVDAEMLELAERIAERDLRLRIGLERDVARLDPETRSR